jgi:hypothetical protein
LNGEHERCRRRKPGCHADPPPPLRRWNLRELADVVAARCHRLEKGRRFHHHSSTLRAPAEMMLDVRARLGRQHTIGVLGQALGIRMPQVV